MKRGMAIHVAKLDHRNLWEVTREKMKNREEIRKSSSCGNHLYHPFTCLRELLRIRSRMKNAQWSPERNTGPITAVRLWYLSRHLAE